MKKLALILAVLLVCTSLFTACNTGGGTQGQKVYKDDGKQVTLKWLLAGPGKQAMSDQVWAEFNKQLAKYLPNTTVQFECISFADYPDKWNLMKQSSEKLDIVWAGWFSPFIEDVQAGAYLPITDILNKDAKNLKSEFPDWVWKKTTVDNQIYAVPSYQVMNDVLPSLDTYKEDSDKYLDKQKWIDTYAKSETMTAETWAMWDDYFAKLKENGKLKAGFGGDEYLLC